MKRKGQCVNKGCERFATVGDHCYLCHRALTVFRTLPRLGKYEPTGTAA